MSVSLTLHNVDEGTAKWIQIEAQRRGMDMENIAIQLIRQAIRNKPEDGQMESYHDLDSLAGTWTKEETDAFLKNIVYFNQVDTMLWQ